MNFEDREAKSRPVIAKHTPASTPDLEWSDDQPDLALPADSNEKQIRSEHLSAWLSYWCVIWSGITVMGPLFGGFVGLWLAGGEPMRDPFSGLFSGMFFGGLWAGAVGLFVIVHLGAICWTFQWLDSPLTIGWIAGAFTGVICGLFYLSLLTAPLGAAGAYLAGDSFLKTKMGNKFLDTIETYQGESLGAMKFTMMDLFLRVTVFAVFLAGWTAWLRAF